MNLQRMSKRNVEKAREWRTSSIPHPVGKNARKHTNISRKVIWRNTIKTIKIAVKATNIKNLIRRKNSWKSALNVRLPTDTVCKEYRQLRKETRNMTMLIADRDAVLRTLYYYYYKIHILFTFTFITSRTATITSQEIKYTYNKYHCKHINDP